MPRAGLAKHQLGNALDSVLFEIQSYVEKTAIGDLASAFTNPTHHGLLVGVGESKYFLSPFTGNAMDDGPLPSGLLSFDELRALPIRTLEPVVENLIFEGETVLLAGRPKVGKTRLVHQLAFVLEGGTPFLGLNIPKQRRVLIVDLENRPGALRDRLIRMAGQRTAAPGLFIWSAQSLREDVINATQAGVARLQAMIKKAHADVLIIDPWRLWLGADENDAERVVQGLRALASLRESRPRLTIIIIHHVRKERFDSPRKLLADPNLWVESVSGHHALLSHVDSCYGLERQRDESGEEMIVFAGVARNTDPRVLLLEDDEETLRFEVRKSEDALQDVLTPKEKEIWKVAMTLVKFGFNELVTASKVTNRKAVSSTIKKAESHGRLIALDKRYEVVGGGAA
ncbi:MAG TPA: AAA family ATPase [Bryobacteraceae bacterium]|jgi:hypothetical protein